MKIYIFTLLFVSVLTKGLIADTKSDVNVLQPNKHIKGGVEATFGFSLSIRTDRLLYSQQLAAIADLGESQKPMFVDVLIPYLDYASSIENANRSPLLQVTLDQLRQDWPAFDAILKLPGSQKYIVRYVLSSSNPLDLRLTALLVLRYKNEDAFVGTKGTLLKEYANQKHILDIIESLDVAPFSGEVSISPPEKENHKDLLQKGADH